MPYPHLGRVIVHPTHWLISTQATNALDDGVLTGDVHNLLARLHNRLFQTFAGPPPIERLAGGLRFEYSLQLINLGFVLP